jgi:competence protein ComEA
MQAAPSPSTSVTPALWPRSAQLATAFLLGLATVLLAVHAFGSLRRSARPTELERLECAYQVDLNHADRSELLQLPGVGENLARRILDYRREHNGFGSVEELRKVRGVGPVTLERLRPLVCVTDRHEWDEESNAPTLTVSTPASPHRTREASPSSPATTDKAAKLAAPLDISRASAEELKQLPGIGPMLAQRIVEARDKKPFQAVDDLRRVRGIGAKTLEKLRPFVIVGGENGAPGRIANTMQAQAQRDDSSLKEN